MRQSWERRPCYEGREAPRPHRRRKRVLCNHRGLLGRGDRAKVPSEESGNASASLSWGGPTSWKGTKPPCNRRRLAETILLLAAGGKEHSRAPHPHPRELPWAVMTKGLTKRTSAPWLVESAESTLRMLALREASRILKNAFRRWIRRKA